MSDEAGGEVAAASAVVLCDCGASRARSDSLREAEALLVASGKAALRVQDLCGAVARRDGRLLEWACGRPLLVIACRARAVRWLLHAAGLGGAPVRVVDLGQDPAVVRAELEAPLATLAAGAIVSLATDDAWLPWFPVVDEERCGRCGQCASFCVFGVYAARADGGVTVARPRSCKTNCPACARTCPSAAIVFPKHDEPPFDGSPIADEDAVAARTRQYAQQLLGSDPYAALAERRRKGELLRRGLTGSGAGQ